MSKADLRKQPAQVAAMFDEVSTHYDRTNTVLSMGNAALWRQATTRAVAPRAGESILDIAAGTGTSSASLARNGARVVAADFSEGMIEVGRRRQSHNPFITFEQADATALPFDDDSFDAVTISFGLRNIVDPGAALAEFYRVTKPGGRVVICEFSRPPAAVIRTGYGAYLRYAMPLLARAASSNPAAYEYLMESIEAWPDQPKLAAWLRGAGYERVAWRNLTAGIVALHRGWKPAISGTVPMSSTQSGETPSEKPAAEKNTARKPGPAKKSAAEKTAIGDRSVASSPSAKPAPAKSTSAKSTSAKSTSAKSSSAQSSATSAAAESATPKSSVDSDSPRAQRRGGAPAPESKSSSRAAAESEGSSVVPPEGE